MGGMGFPFVTFAAQIDGNIFLINQQDIVSRMGGMTAAAIARFYRLAQPLVFGVVNRPFLQLDRIRVTLAAGVDHGRFQKLFLFRAVGVVAVQTADIIHQR